MAARSYGPAGPLGSMHVTLAGGQSPTNARRVYSADVYSV